VFSPYGYQALILSSLNNTTVRIEEKELEEITSQVNNSLEHLDLADRRQVLWNLLRVSVSEDWEGMEWMYEQLKKFIEDEFEW
jgi:hypothetical protein